MDPERDLVGSLLAGLGIEPAGFTDGVEPRIYTIELGDYLLNAFHDRERSIVILFTCVLRVPKEDPERYLRPALQANLFGIETEGCWWGWDEAQEALVLERRENADLFDETRLALSLVAIHDSAERLLADLAAARRAEGDSDIGPEPKAKPAEAIDPDEDVIPTHVPRGGFA